MKHQRDRKEGKTENEMNGEEEKEEEKFLFDIKRNISPQNEK